MKFLLTNDDGIDAPGLAAFRTALSQFGEVLVVAPDSALSGCSHQVNAHKDLTLVERGAGEFALDGTPADCVRVALTHLQADIDWVCSGINHGGNLGVDVFLSGTVAAARESVILGKPAIAISQYRRTRAYDRWELSSQCCEPILASLLAKPIEPGQYWNVNLPDPDASVEQPEAVVCPLDTSPLPVHYDVIDGKLRYRGNYHQRVHHPEHDIAVCFGGRIAVTPLTILQGR